MYKPLLFASLLLTPFSLHALDTRQASTEQLLELGRELAAHAGASQWQQLWQRVRQAGWQTLAQDQSTSIVYGMPKAAKELGAACEVLPLDQIARSIVRALPLRPASGLISPRKGATHG